MKVLVFFAALAVASGQDLSSVKYVYLLPMAGGLDQYLAVRLAASHLFLVVTDPTKADAVFTDRIGANFEDTLRELYAPVEPSKLGDEFKAPAMAPLTRVRGSFFLVDHKTHSVVWSTYAQHKSNQATELNRLAGQIVHQLEKDLSPKK
jgi:hypothetical protein